jgi:hypothetical protein
LCSVAQLGLYCTADRARLALIALALARLAMPTCLGCFTLFRLSRPDY